MQRVNQPLEQVDPAMRANPDLMGPRLLAVMVVGALIAAVMLAH